MKNSYMVIQTLFGQYFHLDDVPNTKHLLSGIRNAVPLINSTVGFEAIYLLHNWLSFFSILHPGVYPTHRRVSKPSFSTHQYGAYPHQGIHFSGWQHSFKHVQTSYYKPHEPWFSKYMCKYLGKLL